MRHWPLALVLLTGCPQDAGLTIGSEPVACNLSLDNLDGTSWVMLEPVFDRGDVENPQARARFTREGDTLKLKYTVKALGDVYDYTCARKGEEIACVEDVEASHLQAWCRAYEVHEEGSCSRKKIEEIGAPGFTDAEIDAAIEAAEAEVAKYRGGPDWDRFALANNTLGSKLQARFYAKVDEKKCRLRVTDNYMTIYNGKIVEDSNPVGTNPFVKTDEELLWETCPDGRSLVDLSTAEVPADLSTIPPRRVHATPPGTVVHYHYLGQAAVKPREGCTYSKDVWAQWKPVAKGVPAPVEGDRVDWSTTHTWDDVETLELVSPLQPTGVLTLVRYEECGGEKEKIDVVCNATVFDARPQPE